MKKKLLFLLCFCFTTVLFSQSISITSVVEGDCGNTQLDAVNVIEIYVSGTLDVSNYRVQLQFNGSSWTLPSAFSGSYTDQFLYIVSDANNFKAEFPQVNNAFINAGATGTFANGSRAIRIIDTANSNEVIDVYGVDSEEGTGKPWEYTNSYAQKVDLKEPSPVFDASNWVIMPLNSLNGLGSCNGNAKLNETVKLGTFKAATPILSTNKLEQEAFSVLPNPASNNFKIVSNNGFQNGGVFTLYSLTGEKIMEQKILSQQDTFDISFVASGLYILKIKNQKGSLNYKLIKE